MKLLSIFRLDSNLCSTVSICSPNFSLKISNKLPADNWPKSSKMHPTSLFQWEFFYGTAKSIAFIFCQKWSPIFLSGSLSLLWLYYHTTESERTIVRPGISRLMFWRHDIAPPADPRSERKFPEVRAGCSAKERDRFFVMNSFRWSRLCAFCRSAQLHCKMRTNRQQREREIVWYLKSRPAPTCDVSINWRKLAAKLTT